MARPNPFDGFTTRELHRLLIALNEHQDRATYDTVKQETRSLAKQLTTSKNWVLRDNTLSKGTWY